MITTSVIQSSDSSRRSASKRERADLLERFGDIVLRSARDNYEKKSEGGTGSDGIKWKPNHPRTIARKARKSPKVKNLVEQRKRLAKLIGRASEARSRRLRERRATLLRQIQRIEGQFADTNRIGVDTALQEASGIPEFDGGDGKGGNIIEFESDRAITVGYGRTYSEKFDSVRKLFPEELPAPVESLLEEEAVAWVVQRLRTLR